MPFYHILPHTTRMASQAPQLHFVLFPFMAQGHMIPMMDVAKILVQHNVIVTVVTTPHNAARFASITARYIEAGFQIRIAQLQFPSKESGLPEECENLDMLPSLGMGFSFFNAANCSWQPVEKLFEELTPAPSCIISDMGLPYTIHIARKFNIPRISFAAMEQRGSKVSQNNLILSGSRHRQRIVNIGSCLAG
ncbi:UDP-glycosyltransferase 73C1 [Spatholobus suberectus]|nr:UDP-glycosyltransferase 73C1 [Spatholobus suberectus]